METQAEFERRNHEIEARRQASSRFWRRYERRQAVWRFILNLAA